MMKKTKCDLQVKRMNNEFQLLQQPEHRRLLRLKNSFTVTAETKQKILIFLAKMGSFA